MSNYIKGFMKYNIKNLLGIKSNVSIFSIIDGNSRISNKAKVARGCKLKNVDIGDYSYISKGSDINNCKIGRFCSIAPNVKIGFGIHPTHLVSTSPLFYSPNNIFGYSFDTHNNIIENKKTTIENDVWIGVNSVILDGVKVGNGSIIAAGAVVVKDVAPYSIVGGVPARVIKYRFEDATVKKLLKSEWWNMNEDDMLDFIKSKKI